MRFEDENLDEEINIFQSDAHDAIEALARDRFPGLFLRSNALVFTLFDPIDGRERIHVSGPDGQSGVLTVGLLEQAKHFLLIN